MQDDRLKILKELYKDFKETEGKESKISFKDFSMRFDLFSIDDLKIILKEC